MGVCIDQCHPIFVVGPLITDVDPNVVMFWDLPFEVAAHLLIGPAPEHLAFL
jgi:hypothetical protein